MVNVSVISAIISAVVAILIAVANHFIIEPWKEKKRWKKQQLANFYAPLYGLVLARINLVKSRCLAAKKIMLGSIKEKDFLNDEYLNKFVLLNAGYASNQLLELWVKYCGSFPRPSDEIKHDFVATLIKEYNSLKKDLKLDHDPDELETGIPDIIKSIRN